jgi:hypothetical protein
MIARPMEERSSRRRFALALALLVLAGAPACRREASRTADRVLERFRRASGAKPLAASGMMRLSLTGAPGTSGVDEIRWESFRYREEIRSAGLETARGMESGRAWYRDGDGVTRVVSDEVLRELKTRSYFFRRAWLFADRENAWVELGPSDGDRVSLDLTPEGGNRLRLTFSSADGRLLAANAPRLALDFETLSSWTDRSDPSAAVRVAVAWTGLPTGPIPGVSVGGGRAVVPDPPRDVPFEGRSGAVLVDASISGRPVRLAIDAAESGPVAISPALSEQLGLRFETDVWGRRIANGASLEIAGATWPSLWVRREEALPAGAQARAGAPLFRETVVEMEPTEGVLRLHDPERLALPDGFYRAVIDDDGDVPVAILSRGKTNLRLAAGSDTASFAVRIAAASAERAGVERGEARGFAWGPVRLPPMPASVTAHGFFPDWGDDGLLGYPLLLRFHAFVDMPRRWIYLKPLP